MKYLWTMTETKWRGEKNGSMCVSPVPYPMQVYGFMEEEVVGLNVNYQTKTIPKQVLATSNLKSNWK